MKKFMYCILIMCIMSFTSCVSSVNNTQKGTVVGAGAGYVGSSILGADTNTAILYGAGGAIVGYLIGDEMDKKEELVPKKNCTKVTTKRTINGKTTETIEERCVETYK